MDVLGCTASETILPWGFTWKKTDAFLIITVQPFPQNTVTSISKANRPLCFKICHLTDILMSEWQQISTSSTHFLLKNIFDVHKQNKYIKKKRPTHTLAKYHRLHTDNTPNAHSKTSTGCTSHVLAQRQINRFVCPLNCMEITVKKGPL